MTVARPARQPILLTGLFLCAVTCSHAPGRRAASPAPLRYTRATAANIISHGDGAIHLYVLHFELTNPRPGPLALHGWDKEDGFLVPLEQASFYRSVDGAWRKVRKTSGAPLDPKRTLRVAAGETVHVQVQWFEEGSPLGRPLRACLSVDPGRKLCSDTFAVAGAPPNSN